MLQLLVSDLITNPTFTGHNVRVDVDIELRTRDFHLAHFQATAIDIKALFQRGHGSKWKGENHKPSRNINGGDSAAGHMAGSDSDIRIGFRRA